MLLLEPDFQAVQAGLGPQSINPSHSGGTAQAAPSCAWCNARPGVYSNHHYRVHSYSPAPGPSSAALRIINNYFSPYL